MSENLIEPIQIWCFWDTIFRTLGPQGINIVYCGSFIQQDFGERVGEHGYLIWDVEHLDYTEHDIDTDYGYYVFKINSLEDLDTGKEYLTNA